MSTPHATASRDPLVLAIVNARVFTGDVARPWADAVLVRDAVVVAVGGSAELRKRAGSSARVIDVRGMLVLPRDSSASLIAGAPADLVVVDRARSDERRFPFDEAEVVLALHEGRVTLDRDALAR